VTRDIQRVDHLCVPFGLSDKCVEFHSCLHHNYLFLYSDQAGTLTEWIAP
jgi:hypothetical protein